MWSHHHRCWTTGRVHVIALLMDQPERRGSNSLLGGNSKQHAMFGVSCNFPNLKSNFSACPVCLAGATDYLKHEEFTSALQLKCSTCYGFSLSRLTTNGTYLETNESLFDDATPGYGLLTVPGVLSFPLLNDAWQYAISCFVDNKSWTKEDVKAYFAMLCINTTTTDYFI